MHIAIAFVVIAALIVLPVFSVTAWVGALGMRSLPVWQPLVAIVAAAGLGALVFGGIWALVAPLFGG